METTTFRSYIEEISEKTLLPYSFLVTEVMKAMTNSNKEYFSNLTAFPRFMNLAYGQPKTGGECWNKFIDKLRAIQQRSYYTAILSRNYSTDAMYLKQLLLAFKHLYSLYNNLPNEVMDLIELKGKPANSNDYIQLVSYNLLGQLWSHANLQGRRHISTALQYVVTTYNKHTDEELRVSIEPLLNLA